MGAGLFGAATGIKIPTEGKPIDAARKFAEENLDLFIEQSCKLATKATKAAAPSAQVLRK